MYQINFNSLFIMDNIYCTVSDLCYRVPGITIATVSYVFPTETDEVGLCCP